MMIDGGLEHGLSDNKVPTESKWVEGKTNKQKTSETHFEVSFTNWAIREALVMDWEAWHAAVHGVEKHQTWLSDWKELNH